MVETPARGERKKLLMRLFIIPKPKAMKPAPAGAGKGGEYNE